MTSTDYRHHRSGLVLVALAATCWSTSGLWVRSIEADVMTLLFWRGVFSGAAVMAVFLIIEGRRALAILASLHWPAFAVAGLCAASMISGISSMRFTTIADAMVIYATVPFVTAGIAYVTIGEKPSVATLAASALAVAGVVVMLWGTEFGDGLFGKVLAFVNTVTMASFTVLMRRHREVAMLPAMGLAAWLCSSFCWFFAAPLSVSLGDLGRTAAFGITQNGAGLVLYTFGSKRVPAAEATLIGALEVPLTPLWVWLLIGEAPSTQTLLGGGVVLAALFGHMLMEFRRNPEDELQPFQAAP